MKNLYSKKNQYQIKDNQDFIDQSKIYKTTNSGGIDIFSLNEKKQNAFPIPTPLAPYCIPEAKKKNTSITYKGKCCGKVMMKK